MKKMMFGILTKHYAPRNFSIPLQALPVGISQFSSSLYFHRYPMGFHGHSFTYSMIQIQDISVCRDGSVTLSHSDVSLPSKFIWTTGLIHLFFLGFNFSESPLCVANSRFSTLLSVLIQFKWLTIRRLSGFGINAKATIRLVLTEQRLSDHRIIYISSILLYSVV